MVEEAGQLAGQAEAQEVKILEMPGVRARLKFSVSSRQGRTKAETSQHLQGVQVPSMIGDMARLLVLVRAGIGCPACPACCTLIALPSVHRFLLVKSPSDVLLVCELLFLADLGSAQ
eukprot:gnl/TRDRNA2_/TRDRNA2_177152_c3_seq1.p1 gnl/TRDRNA2_/TRDRNA2_177152_c3~~gnl/TRDRNA2_/TRDRNA2_177152_c3_seq1.p1  ORF type:complete len:117 (+),score=10.97 gnl/TRDRNA2_/TRDRNA2_177152_c3_seq1:45-395(+)